MDLDLPSHLEVRTRQHPASRGDRLGNQPTEFVLYWMHTAVRGHENPALDTACFAALNAGLPLLVYHGLSQRYDFASDRHHTFILEGARDVQAELDELGISYVFHLERGSRTADDPKRPLLDLAARAALVVTEDMPTRPLDRWANRLAEHSAAPLWLVDTACIVPMQSVASAPERAFAYRDQTANQRSAQLGKPWPAREQTPRRFDGELPFAPIDLQGTTSHDLADLVATCPDIDHEVGPVPETRGGSQAGYRRWNTFVESGLSRYAARRNDPLVEGGVSRMSAYLHYGHVSPFRLAREAHKIGGDGAKKYLDELLIWREIAYAFCFHKPSHTTLDAIPQWAQDTLSDHALDPRDAHYSRETLARSRSGNPLWDAAQTSLRIHGELHNNVRMTWGKAFTQWTETPEEAYQLALDLNHRYALDGRDPASYGGILWCFGLFDRPFSPEQPIYGKLRFRPLEDHAKRTDVDRYTARVHRPLSDRAKTIRIAVIGAGLAGLTCARTLSDHGIEVEVFDKARGPAGRMSTRRQYGEDAAAPATFDHGAQYFTARDPRFRAAVASWIHDGLVAEWHGEIHAVQPDLSITPLRERTVRYTGVPGMNAICKHLADDLSVATGFRVARLDRGADHRWTLQAEDGRTTAAFDAVVCAIPAPQAATLLREVSPELSATAAAVSYEPCLTVMARFEQRVDYKADGAFVAGSPLSWVARDSSKPGRPDGERWVLHASPEWSREHFEDDPKAVAAELMAAFARVTGDASTRAGALETTPHRWAFALPSNPLSESFAWDPAAGLAMAGDWCAGPRVEGAYLSGAALAGRLLTFATVEPAHTTSRA